MRCKYEEKEKELKQKHREKEDLLKEDYLSEIKNLSQKIEELALENDKQKFDIIDLKAVIDDYENAKHEREIEFKREILLRESDYEKLQKKLREMQAEVEELENKISEKANDFTLKLRHSEQNEGKFTLQLAQKDRIVKELDEQLNGLRNVILDLEAGNKECELKSENRQKIIEQLKAQNDELLNKIKNLENELGRIQQNNMKELELITHRITELMAEKDHYAAENEDLKNALLKATNRIRELNEVIEVKYQGIENQFLKEKTLKENLERKLKDFQKKYSLNNESLIKENNELKNLLEKKNIEMENSITKYQTKIHKVNSLILFICFLSSLFSFCQLYEKNVFCCLIYFFKLLYAILCIIHYDNNKNKF